MSLSPRIPADQEKLASRLLNTAIWQVDRVALR